MHKVKLLDLAFDKLTNRIYTLNDHWILEVFFFYFLIIYKNIILLLKGLGDLIKCIYSSRKTQSNFKSKLRQCIKYN